MDPRKTNAKRGYQKRQREREESRRLASEWQPEISEEDEMYQENVNTRRKFPWWAILLIVFGVLALSSCCCVLSVGGLFFPHQSEAATEVPVVPTEIPTEAPPVVEQPTEAPAPVPVICTTPSIIASAVLDGKTLTTTGLFLDTNLGKRMTFTSRSLLVPEKAWNDPLTAEELKTVEETWQFMQVCIPDGLFGRIFAGGFEQGINRYENGVLITLQPGVYEFKLRNGEIVLWYPQQEEFASKDLERIVEQIKFGNFDIHSELAFFGVTADILPKLDQALVKERNVQLVVAPDPMVIK